MKKHLVELLTEGKFTTVEVYFQNMVPEWARTMKPAPAPAYPQPAAPAYMQPSPGRVPFSAVKDGKLDSSALRPGEFEMLSAAFPFISAQMPEKTYTYKVSHELAAKLQSGDTVVIPDRKVATQFLTAKVWVVHPSAQIDYQAKHDYAWVVQKVDIEEYRKNLDQEAAFRSMVERSEQERIRVETRKNLLATIAPTDPEEYVRFMDAMKLLGIENPETVVPALATPEVKA